MKKQNYLAPALGLALALTLLCSGCGSSDTTDGSPDLTPPDSMSMVKDYDIQTDADAFVGTWLPRGTAPMPIWRSPPETANICGACTARRTWRPAAISSMRRTMTASMPTTTTTAWATPSP